MQNGGRWTGRAAGGALLLALALPAGAQQAAAGPAAPRTARAVRVAGAAPAVDGRLDDAAWAQADTATGFVQRTPRAGAPASERTVVRVLYGPDALYVGARMYDSAPDSVAGQLNRRDVGGYGDAFTVMVDSYDDRRTAFRFGLNPRGVKYDGLLFDDTDEDSGWDAVWDGAAQRDSLGWTAELRIPFSQLRYPAAAGERTWGVNFRREIARRGELSYWAPILPDDPGFVSRFGRLAGIGELPRPRRLEVQPYASSRLARAPGDAGDPFHRDSDVLASAGADVRYGITSDLTLSATLNPDFGQVEVDPAVVNLSAYETLFDERRPFFVEGTEMFRFGQARFNVATNLPRLFYSRRIGQPPVRRLGGAGFGFVDAPEQTTIAAAAKVSGKLGRGWSLGVMDAATAPERARYVDAEGVRRTAPVEPFGNYFVGRLRRDLGGASWAGAYLTAVNRAVDDGALDAVARTAGYVGGMDGELAWGGRSWILAGSLAGSHVAGSAASIAAAQRRSSRYFQRPDADHLDFDPERTSLDGYSLQLSLSKLGGRHWRSSAWYQETSPGFEANDLGYQVRADIRALTAYLSYREDRPGAVFREWNASSYGLGTWNLAGDNTRATARAQASGTLKSFWYLFGGVEAARRSWDDRLTRGGPLARFPGDAAVDFGVGSDERRSLSGEASFSASRTGAGGWGRTASLFLRARPTSALQLSVGPQLERRRGIAQYVGTMDDATATATLGRRYLFAGLDRTTLSLPTRVNWTFSPDLSLQLYAQPLIDVGDYTEFKELAAPRTYRFRTFGEDGSTALRDDAADRYLLDPDGAAGPARAFTVADPDFNFRSLRGNAVLRWEYRPGSTLFFVWQQQRSEEALLGDFRLGRDSGAMLRAPSENVFLIKATYWLGF
jgi:hypothetical protein